MATRLTIEQIQPEFKRRGYELLSTEYINNATKLDYICPEGHKGSITWISFSHGRGCRLCAHKRRRVPLKRIRSAFEKRGYELLSNSYVNCDAPLEFICPQGHKNTISWSNFNQGHGCSECSNNRKMTIDQVYQYFEKEGCLLLSTDYINAHTKLEFECSNGHRHEMTWNNFQKGERCPKCWEYKSEKRLGEILEKIFPGKVRQQCNLGFLGKQKVDYWIVDTRLAFEYDGEQHFRPVRFNGISWEEAEKVHRKVIKRDCRKNSLCEQYGYTLIRFSYTEKLSTRGVKSKLKKYNINYALSSLRA